MATVPFPSGKKTGISCESVLQLHTGLKEDFRYITKDLYFKYLILVISSTLILWARYGIV